MNIQNQNQNEIDRSIAEIKSYDAGQMQALLHETAVTYGADPACNHAEALEALVDKIERVYFGLRDPEEKLNYARYNNKFVNKHPSDFIILREALRQHAMASVLLGSNKGEFTGEFHGEGDSGNYEIETGDHLIDKFLEQMLERHVHFDWYNSDGGGGDITWDVARDKIVINGYQNVVQTESVMTEEEF